MLVISNTLTKACLSRWSLEISSYHNDIIRNKNQGGHKEIQANGKPDVHVTLHKGDPVMAPGDFMFFPMTDRNHLRQASISPI